MSDRKRLMFFGLALLMLCGCAGPGGWLAGKPALAAGQGEDRLATPAWVLDGTDLLEPGDLRRAELPPDYWVHYLKAE